MWFKPKYKIVEVERPRRTPDDLPELRDGLRGLANNPYFGYLLGRLRDQRAVLETRLKQRFANTEDINFVQCGVFWTGWLEHELNRLTEAPQKPTLDPVEQEIEAFKIVDSLLERVGTTD